MRVGQKHVEQHRAWKGGDATQAEPWNIGSWTDPVIGRILLLRLKKRIIAASWSEASHVGDRKNAGV